MYIYKFTSLYFFFSIFCKNQKVDVNTFVSPVLISVAIIAYGCVLADSFSLLASSQVRPSFAIVIRSIEAPACLNPAKDLATYKCYIIIISYKSSIAPSGQQCTGRNIPRYLV